MYIFSLFESKKLTKKRLTFFLNQPILILTRKGCEIMDKGKTKHNIYDLTLMRSSYKNGGHYGK